MKNSTFSKSPTKNKKQKTKNASWPYRQNEKWHIQQKPNKKQKTKNKKLLKL